jgi:hypothetical protein
MDNKTFAHIYISTSSHHMSYLTTVTNDDINVNVFLNKSWVNKDKAAYISAVELQVTGRSGKKIKL